MGYEKNRGLGRNAQGRVEPVEESKQIGRRGLGFTFKDFTNDTAEWDFDNDPVTKDFSFFFSIFKFCFILIGTSRRRNSLVSTK